jgi:hypothetical protein
MSPKRREEKRREEKRTIHPSVLPITYSMVQDII